MTGSTSGIGAAIARRLSNEGYAVVLHSRSSAEKGHALAAELGNAIYIQADLADDADRIRLVREAVSRWERLDVLVNNAGMSRVIPHTDLMAASPAVWHELHEVNVVAPFRLVAEAETALRAAARRGRSQDVSLISAHTLASGPGAPFHPLCRVQSSTQPRHPAARLIARSGHSRKCRRPWSRGHPSDSGLDRRSAALARSVTHATTSQSCGYCHVMMLIASDYLTGEIVVADGGLSLT